MPDGKTKAYLTRQKVDGRYVGEITERANCIMISLVKEVNNRIDTIYLSMPTSIPHSLTFSDVAPWSVRNIHDY